MLEHINEVVGLLAAKGYDGHFRVKGGYGVPLREGLEKKMGTLRREENGMLAPLRLSTCTHFQHPGRSVVCIFQVNYDAAQGFGIERMEIERHLRYAHHPRLKILNPPSWGKIPTVKYANKLAEQLEQKRKRL